MRTPGRRDLTVLQLSLALNVAQTCCDCSRLLKMIIVHDKNLLYVSQCDPAVPRAYIHSSLIYVHDRRSCFAPCWGLSAALCVRVS